MRTPTCLLGFGLLVLVLLPACGGGSSGGVTPPPMATVNGMVVKDPVTDCDVRVCEVDPDTGASGRTVLGEGRSTIGGGFGFDFRTAPSGIYALSGTEGSFTNRATGLTDGLGAFALRGLFCVDPDSEVTANLTVMSTLIAYRFEFLRTIRPYMTAKLLLQLARQEMREAFGIQDVDACPDPDGTDDERKLFLLDAGLVQMAADLGEPAAEVVHLFCTDLMDGRADGRVCGEDARLTSGAAWNPSPLQLLGIAIGLWLATNPLNDTGIGPGDPIVAALQGRLDTWVVRGVISQLPRILSFSHRFVREQAGTEVTCHLAPFHAPADVEVRFLDATGRDFVRITPTMVTTDAFGVHEVAFVVPSLPKGVHPVAVVHVPTGLFDVEPLGACTPGLIRVDEVLPRRGIITGGSLVKVRGEGFDPENPPVVRLGGRVATVDRVISPNCLRVFTPPGLTPGPVDLDVGGVVVPGAFDYLDVDPLLPPASEGLRRLLLVLAGEIPGAEPRMIDGILNLELKTYEFREHRTTDTDPLGTLLEGDFDGDTTTDPSVSGDTRQTLVLDNGLVLDVVRPHIDQDPHMAMQVTARLPGGPGLPPSTVGMGLMMSMGNPGERILRTFDITGACIENGLRTVIRGQATFRADGRVFISGGISKRSDGGRESYAPLLAVGRYEVGGNGNVTLSDFPAAAGFTFMKGLVDPRGRSGTVILKGPGKLVHLMLAARRTERDVPVDGFGPDLAYALARLDSTENLILAARRALSTVDGTTLALGSLYEATHDPSTGEVEERELVHAKGGYASFEGRLSSPDGKDVGRLGDGTGVHWDPLPQDGLGTGGDHEGSGLGYGSALGGESQFTNRSWFADYKVLAMGIELMPDATKAPNPEHRSVMELGCLVRETDEADVDGFTFSMASKIRWDRLKRKEVDRNAAGVVSTSISGPSSESGFAIVATGDEFFAFACPLPAEGTKCFFRGCFSADGSIGIARSSDGFGAPWHAVLLRKPREAPRVDGTYNTRFFCHTFDGASTAYAINGAGTYTFDGTLGTYAQDTSQVGISETLTSFPSGPDQFPGVFTVDAEGCIDMTTDFGGGFMSGLCGAVHENGSVVVTMNPEAGAINCLTMYTLRDAAGAPAMVPEKAKFCGLHLDFDGSGGITAATRAGRIGLRPGLLDRSLRTATWSNATEAVTVALDMLTARPMTEMPGRTFSSDLALGRGLDGARSAGLPVVGSQGESGAEAPAGSFGVSLRAGK